MRNELDMKHNTVPVLTCEGRCSKDRVTWTTHEFIHEYRDKDLHGWRQDYACTICGEYRQFGLTESRVTPRGENN